MLRPEKQFHHNQKQNRSLTDTRNSIHGSNSDKTAEAEIKFFFPEFKYEQFFSCGQDEQFLKSQMNQSLRLDRTLFQHFI